MKKFELTLVTKRPQIEGELKIGIDANAIASLSNIKEIYGYVKDIIDKLSHCLYTHEICRDEAIRALIHNFKVNRIKAKKKVDDFIKEYNITIIKRDPKNDRLAQEYAERCEGRALELHKPDKFILADLIANGINYIFSQDKEFMDCCEFLGIAVSKLLDFKTKEEQDNLKMFFENLDSN